MQSDNGFKESLLGHARRAVVVFRERDIKSSEVVVNSIKLVPDNYSIAMDSSQYPWCIG